MRFTALTFAALSTFVAYASAKPTSAIAYLNTSDVQGVIHFYQESFHSPTRVVANITGLAPGLHGFHIHEFGDLSNGCASTGSHYNPFNKTHGGPDVKDRHVGDLGNISVDNSTGVAFLNTTSDYIKLKHRYSIIGRAVVVHTGEDDLGLGGSPLSNTTGNAGGRLACAVIGRPSTTA
ncbi:copper/zinc superoxide dismutase [Sporodiniella umbellata]|nr:copper/zinc superoxide dismutase [Sporodiniella umbellata]